MSTNLCNYANTFGEPNTGLHSIRVFDIAIVDVLATILLALILTIILKYIIKVESPFLNVFIIILILLFILGVILHRIFCVKTTIDKLIFGNE